jgi:hypothetical protein
MGPGGLVEKLDAKELVVIPEGEKTIMGTVGTY